ncbi:MAG: hypothetical protein QM695_07045 [Micropruina sp.]
MTIYNILDLEEPAYILNGVLVPAADGSLQLADQAGRANVYPTEFRALFEYFTRLRTQSEALDARSRVGFDADDLAALVQHGLLWRLTPGAVAAQIRAARFLLRAAVAERQDWPGFVLFKVDADTITPVSEAGAALFKEAAGQPLGPTITRVAATAGIPEQQVMRTVAADLTRLLSTGTVWVQAGESL